LENVGEEHDKASWKSYHAIANQHLPLSAKSNTLCCQQKELEHKGGQK